MFEVVEGLLVFVLEVVLVGYLEGDVEFNFGERGEDVVVLKVLGFFLVKEKISSFRKVD